jgi:hypothetical protein
MNTVVETKEVQGQITEKIGLVEFIIEPRINEENWFELETSSEHKRSELIRMSEDDIQDMIGYFVTFSAIRKVKFDSRRMGVEVTTSDGTWHRLGSKFINDEIERNRISDILNSKNDSLDGEELLELFDILEGELVSVDFNTQDDPPFTLPPATLESFMGNVGRLGNYLFGSSTTDDDYYHSINFSRIETVHYSPVVPGLSGCQIDIEFNDGSMITFEQQSGF